MDPKSFAKLTLEDDLTIRKWKWRLAAVYGAWASSLTAVSIQAFPASHNALSIIRICQLSNERHGSQAVPLLRPQYDWYHVAANEGPDLPRFLLS